MPVDARVKIVLTNHCYVRAVERFSPEAAADLEQKLRDSDRMGAQTKDGLRAYKHRLTGMVFLVIEKTAVSMGGIYELEAITTITSDMLARTRVVQGEGS